MFTWKRFVSLNRWLLPYAVMVLIFTTILLPKLPLFDIPNTYVKIRIDDVVQGIVALIWFLGFTWFSKKFYKNLINRTIFFYWFVGFVSAVSAILITQVVFPNLVFLHWARRIEYMVFFFVGVSATPNVKMALRYSATAFIGGVAAIIYTIGQVKWQWCAISTTNREFAKGDCIPLTPGARPNASFAGQYDLSVFLGFIVPIIVSVFFVAKQYWLKVAMVGMFLLTFYALVLTQSRWAVFAAGVTVIAFLWVGGKRLLLAGFIGAAVLLVGGAVLFNVGPARALVTRYVTTAQVLQQRRDAVVPTPIAVNELIRQTTSAGGRTTLSDSAIPGQEELPTESEYKRMNKRVGPIAPDPALETNLSTNIRFDEEWPQAWRAFLRNPLVGSGYASLGVLYDDQLGFATDNDYLRMLGETGIFGTLAFFFILFAFIKLVFPYLQQHREFSVAKGLVIGLSMAVVGFYINAVFIDVFEASKTAVFFWLFAGILVGIINSEQQVRE